ncbi:MAG: hypothetical protein KGI38_08465 [Thaumarchaeota archaeon]|nr:hypothetical protein [Nitrososphaerota archaeon]
MNLQLLFRITGIALFIQLAIGGLVTFGYIDSFVHIIWGVVLGVLALVTLAFVFRMQSRPKQLVGLTIGIGVDILLQGLLGFAALGTGSNVISFVHFLNALAIYGMTLAGTFMAMRAGHMVPPSQAVS